MEGAETENEVSAPIFIIRGIIMKSRHYKILSTAILLMLNGAFVHAEDGNTVLDTVYVVGNKTQTNETMPGELVNQKAKLGILGDKSVMDIPYSEMSMTRKMIEKFDDPSQPIANLLLNNPSIRTSTTSPMYTDFSMRGINMNGNHMMLNGVPSLFYQFNGPSSHYIERIDITSGPNAGVNGVSMSNNGTNSGATPAPGTINVVTKKAKDVPNTTYTQTFSGRSNLGEFIDVGRRFGENNEWGVRVMGEYMDGEMSLKGTERNEKNIYLNLDRTGKTSAANLFIGHFDLRVNEGQRWFTYGGNGTELPSAPNSNIPYDFKGTTKWMHGWLFTFNHEKQINDNVSWFTNVGHSARSGNKYNSSSALKFDQNGNFMSDNVANAQNESGMNSYFQTGFKGTFETGKVKHQASIAFDRSWAKYWNDSNNGPKGTIGGSLYTGTTYTSSFIIPQLREAKLSWNEVNTGVTIADSLSYGKWDLLLAASHKHENFQNKLATNQDIKNNNWLPTIGVTYKPNDDIAIYAGQTESFSRGAVVTNGSRIYDNAGDTLAPSTSKQKEIGVKYRYKNIFTTLAYFDIDTESIIDQELDNGLYHRAANGRDNYKGWEWSVNGQPADKWTVTGGILYMNGKREKTNGGTYDGKFINGASKWSGVIGAIYDPNEQWSIISRLVWNGEAFIDNSKSPTSATRIPSYAVLDLGFDYRTHISEVPVSFKVMVYNVFNKDYWMGRGSSTTFGLSMPRTLMVSATLDL